MGQGEMITEIIDIDELIDELETLQGWCEWEHSLEYSEAIDKVIELCREVQERKGKK